MSYADEMRLNVYLIVLLLGVLVGIGLRINHKLTVMLGNKLKGQKTLSD